ncbi:Inositol-tetrakisphosphate 1-kinase [Tupaia chinensis]|uniref:Inositol-tetrakisphosphate 1-kinase n=1 Tax=Tupaia chinensis TaxID=246437 RepID=L9JZA2_TUPCH|nr:Inositol-tetrakisphosphate 1-kinase [Tupaia chinensis]
MPLSIPALQLNLSQPLEEQGPLDVIIHKLTDVILEADQNDSQSLELVHRFQVRRAGLPSDVGCAGGGGAPGEATYTWQAVIAVLAWTLRSRSATVRTWAHGRRSNALVPVPGQGPQSLHGYPSDGIFPMWGRTSVSFDAPGIPPSAANLLLWTPALYLELALETSLTPETGMSHVKAVSLRRAGGTGKACPGSSGTSWSLSFPVCEMGTSDRKISPHGAERVTVRGECVTRVCCEGSVYALGPEQRSGGRAGPVDRLRVNPCHDRASPWSPPALLAALPALFDVCSLCAQQSRVQCGLSREYIDAHPETIVLDPLPAIRTLLDRSKSYELIRKIEAYMKVPFAHSVTEELYAVVIVFGCMLLHLTTKA